MRVRLFFPAFFLVPAVFSQSPSSIAKHPFTFEDMMALKRVGAPVPSPDGKWVVFAAEDVDLEANTKISHLWIVPTSGGESHTASMKRRIMRSGRGSRRMANVSF
jgi:hypothetical protein